MNKLADMYVLTLFQEIQNHVHSVAHATCKSHDKHK